MPERAPRDAAAPWRHIDLVLVVATAAILALGLLMVYSSTRNLPSTSADPAHFLKRQAMFVVVGLAGLVVAAAVDYRVVRDWAPVLYAGAVFALFLVLTPVGTSARGAQSWFALGSFHIEPSELSKLVLIICLSAFCASAARTELDTHSLLIALALAAVPLILIYLQPDVGTNMVFLAIIMAVLLVGGARVRHILLLTLIGVTAVGLVLELGVLKQYQVDRLSAFLDPEGDSQRTAYNLRQSQIAIAAGGVAGRGLFQGTQTNLAFVPEQHTDFIFTAVGEELGFVGAVSLLGLFALVVWRTWRAAVLAKDRFGTLLCVGVLAMMVLQIFENVGMTMGITPIAGIPLPLMSYGGSATVACLMGIGLVLNVHMRRFS